MKVDDSSTPGKFYGHFDDRLNFIMKGIVSFFADFKKYLLKATIHFNHLSISLGSFDKGIYVSI